jgi:hypothetical protein
MHTGQDQGGVTSLPQAFNHLLARSFLSSQFVWWIKVGEKENTHAE